MSRLSLFLLGSPHVEHAGSPVEIGRRKTLALLAFLAVTGDLHNREALAALLWPDSEASRAFAYLRNALWTLKQTPAAEWLEIDHQMVGLRRQADLWLDVAQFRECLAACRAHEHAGSEVCADCLARLTEAVGLYRGDFMVGFGLGDSPAFEEWQFFEAESLRRDLADALERLVRLHQTGGNWESAIACARRWLALDPLDEPVQRCLMGLYARSGQRSAALRQYEECARLLRQELDLAPSQETAGLYQQIQAGQLSEAQALPPSESRATWSHNLPPQPTPFVGRQSELAEMEPLLKDPGCRLLTLVGLGGSGKTRLALEAAGRWGERFADGAFFVPLAPVSAPEFIVSAVVDALRVPLPKQASPGRPFTQALQRHLLDYVRPKQVLLVLDNLEHLLEDVGLIEEILRDAPGVKLLVTSRERLNLRSEWVLEIAGLRFPGQEADPQEYKNYGAVQLFLQSARQTDVGFTPTGEDLAAITHICRLVEGVPLGIELAATWVKVLSCQEIAAEIEANLDFLSTSLRDVPERHRSLRAVFAQSWALLPGDSRACFRKLAIFRGGFIRQAAQDVAGASLNALASLVDKSLLRRAPWGRYEMHELLRQYAEERLAAVPRESDLIRDRHSEHYMRLLGRLEGQLKGSGQKAALEELSRELENVRLAWSWAAVRGHIELIREATLGLFLFYDIRSRFQEGASMFARGVEALGQEQPNPLAAPSETGRALGLLGTIQGWFLRFSDPTQGHAALQEGVTCLESLGPSRELAFANVLFVFARTSASRTEALERLESSLSIYQADGDRWSIAVTQEAFCGVLCGYDNEAAEAYIRSSLQLRRQLGDRWGVSMSLYMWGRVAEEQRDLNVATERYQQSLDLRRELGEDVAGAVGCLNSLGRIARELGNYALAREHYLEGLALSREMGDPWFVAQALDSLGRVACDLGEHDQARDYFERGLWLAENLGDRDLAACFNTGLGNVTLAQGEPEQARRYFERSRELQAGDP